jgi:hypothetical protein
MNMPLITEAPPLNADMPTALYELVEQECC